MRLIILLLLTLSTQFALAADPCIDPQGDQVREEICRLSNSARASFGLHPLRLSVDLSHVAEGFANQMSVKNFFDHISPDGGTLPMRLQEGGVEWDACAENIAMNGKTAKQIVNTWLASEGHRENLLSAKYGKVGIGRSGKYWVQDFTN